MFLYTILIKEGFKMSQTYIYMGRLYDYLIRWGKRAEKPSLPMDFFYRRLLSRYKRRKKERPGRRDNVNVYLPKSYLEQLKESLFHGNTPPAFIDITKPFSVHVEQTTVRVDVDGLRLMVAKVYNVNVTGDGESREMFFKFMHIDFTGSEVDLDSMDWEKKKDE